MQGEYVLGALGVCALSLMLACAGDGSDGRPDDGHPGNTGGDGGGSDDGDGGDGGEGSDADDGGDGQSGGDGGDDGGDDGGTDEGGPGSESEWEIDDAWDAGRRITLTNGRYDFTFSDEMVASASDIRLVLDVRARGGSFQMGMNFNKEIGLNELGGQQFYSYPGPVTAHTIESAGAATKVIDFAFASPSDSNSGMSKVLGTSRVSVSVRWDSDRIDVDLEHPVTTTFGNHNGFNGYFLDQRGFPYTLRMGVDGGGSSFVMNEGGPGPVEGVLGYFVDEQGKLGTYEGGRPSSARVGWKDYYAVEKSGRTILVYTPDFRDVAVTGTYDAAPYYQNLLRPWGEFVFSLYSQTTLGAQLIMAKVPAGDYQERLRILMDRPTPGDPSVYDDWIAELQ